jgi:hypothetical protein
MVPGRLTHLQANQNKILKFTSTKLPNLLNLIYADHLLMVLETIKFLGLQMDNQITWKVFILQKRILI